ncbi:hypothetical protein C2R22_16435 [Salinigranum rubrum]|uniref:DUF7993 domain-containing protein n=1 Tax=Salinigranum rubrum TaxID=755307 RepID=A0A2I8VM80_9EURY|nr:hypothetical protein [Salinigranum rubrum]AUV83036.1 hypothetical protein C2R22_16435 [Salinigranum rubrum]
MVDDRLHDGKRIAELLASELDGLGDSLAGVAITDADREVTPTPEGAHAYRVTLRGEHGGTDTRTEDRDLAVVFVHPDRARVEFVRAPDVAADHAGEEGLRVRPKASHPPRTLVFVEDGAEVKRAVAVFEAVVDTLGDER